MIDAHTGHVLITGASAGIGAAIAREYARCGMPLILTARRLDRLQALAAELAPQVPCTVIAADLARPEAIRHLFQEVQARGLPVRILVNNAGYGVPGAYLSSDWETHAAFLHVMVTSICELTWRFLPGMLERGNGGILNVASLAGLVPGSAGHTLYAASKSFLIKFSESLALEYGPRGIKVCALCPGFTYSEFHDIAGTRPQVSRLPAWMWLSAEEVARQGVAALAAGRTVHVTGRVNRALRLLVKYLPDWAARALIRSRSRDFRNAD